MTLIHSIASKIRFIRRAIAKFIEPSGFEPDPFWDIPIDLGLKGASELRDLLAIDEQNYLFIAGQSWADPRAYVLYTALDEVKKTVMFLVRLREMLQGPKLSPHEDRLTRLVITQVLEEQQGRVRRLLEVLVVLILFQSTNEQSYYRHLLYLEELDNLKSVNSDFEEFYGSRSANIDDSIENQILQIRKVEEKVDLDRCWYLSNKSSSKRLGTVSAGRMLSSMRSRIKTALHIMTDSEKLVFGFTYTSAYGRASESIHYNLNRHDFKLKPGQEMSGASNLGLLSLIVLNRCHQLLA